MRQVEMKFRTWGGSRAGAGRKRRSGARASVPHRAREAHKVAYPVHVTLRARAGLPPLRDRGLLREMRVAIRRASQSPSLGNGFRVVQFSVQNDHVHLIVEARGGTALARGVQGLCVRLARGLNRALGTRGRVWVDRFHSRELTTPRAVRNAIVYVLMNAKKHRMQTRGGVDAFSSAPWFEGFSVRLIAPSGACPVVAPRTWLATAGWRRRGLVRRDERPLAPS